MNYTERKAKNQVFFYITSGSGFMTPLISVLIIPGAVSTAVNMVAQGVALHGQLVLKYLYNRLGAVALPGGF